jgi:dihydrofolate reductase
MKKLFSFMIATADGYYEGPNQEFDWPNVDEEFEEFSVKQLDEVDTLLFGRVTYQLMASYWPTPEAAEQNDARVVERMNNISKIVASRTLDEAEWANTRLIRDVADELGKLKSEPGKDIAVFGSSNLTANLLGAGLVDELRIMVNPVLLGGGKSLFTGTDETLRLKLLSSRPFDSGNVLLTYQPATSF